MQKFNTAELLEDVAEVHNNASHQSLVDAVIRTYYTCNVSGICNTCSNFNTESKCKGVEICNKCSTINSLVLYGEWGSGKSSVVKAVASQMGVGDEIIFDFWKSSGDKLRRAFLETLLKGTKKEGLKIEWNGDQV